MTPIWALLFGVATPVDVFGNDAIPDDVYRAVLALSAQSSTVAPQSLSEEALYTEVALSDFLLASGYDLASVSATVAEDRIVVWVDEGRLDRVIFVGEGALSTIELKAALELPGQVYNRPWIARRLAALKESRSGVIGVKFEVVPVAAVDHQGLQIKDVSLLQTLRFQKPEQHWELRVTFEYAGWQSGFDLGFGYRPPDGLFVQGGYRASALAFESDKLQLDSELAVRLGPAFRQEGSELGLSRILLGAAYFGPTIVDGVLAPFAKVQGEILGRERLDVGLSSYLFAPVSFSLNLELLGFDLLRFQLGGGYELRSLLSTTPLSGATVTVPTRDQDQGRFFAEAQLSFLFNPTELRRDRSHHLRILARHNGPGRNQAEPFQELVAEYQRMIPFGWDELWFGGKGALSFGDVPFYEELALGDGFFRAAFQSDYFVRRAGAAHFEYRLSLSRDLLKVSVYDELLIFEALDETRQREAQRFGTSLGIGLHLLILDAFQANLYLGVGVLSDGAFDIGVGLAVQQAF
ncbi:MAG: hypothetical protein IPG45_08050 [Deltaproteobacteria bacterium]|nr:hypothetical protein [Deltaproteobacteria bacterium]